MNQKSLFLTITLLALLAIGGVFWVASKRATAPTVEPVVTDPVVETPTETEPETPIDTSDWKTYRNEELGIEFKYPNSLQLQFNKVIADPYGAHPEWLFRYISLQSQEFNIEIGVKLVGESDNIKLQGWRTGMPAGEFERKNNKIHVQGGQVEVRHLVFSNDSSEKKETKLVLYCSADEDVNLCQPFRFGGDREALVGIYSVTESGLEPWLMIEKVVIGVITSFREI